MPLMCPCNSVPIALTIPTVGGCCAGTIVRCVHLQTRRVLLMPIDRFSVRFVRTQGRSITYHHPLQTVFPIFWVCHLRDDAIDDAINVTHENDAAICTNGQRTANSPNSCVLGGWFGLCFVRDDRPCASSEYLLFLNDP